MLQEPQRRLLVMVLATGLIGGLVGAGYLALLRIVEGVLGPESCAPGAHVLVLVGVGGVVALATRLLGRPADVELLVDNIHVLGGSEEVRSLRSLIPVSLQRQQGRVPDRAAGDDDGNDRIVGGRTISPRSR